MDLDWEKLVKRYVWHDERTPYFTRVANLTRRQAHYELLAYEIFMGVLAGVLALAGAAQRPMPAALRGELRALQSEGFDELARAAPIPLGRVDLGAQQQQRVGAARAREPEPFLGQLARRVERRRASSVSASSPERTHTTR